MLISQDWFSIFAIREYDTSWLAHPRSRSRCFVSYFYYIISPVLSRGKFAVNSPPFSLSPPREHCIFLRLVQQPRGCTYIHIYSSLSVCLALNKEFRATHLRWPTAAVPFPSPLGTSPYAPLAPFFLSPFVPPTLNTVLVRACFAEFELQTHTSFVRDTCLASERRVVNRKSEEHFCQ